MALEYYINNNDLDKFLLLVNKKVYQYKFIPLKTMALINQYYYKLEFFDVKFKNLFIKDANRLSLYSEQEKADL